MRKLSVLTALLAYFVLTSAAQASLKVGDTITLKAGLNYRTGSGGEFQLGISGGDPTAFHTFCAETKESLGSPAYVKSLGLVTMNQGGVLKEDAAHLYRDYYNAMYGLDNGFQGVTGTNYTGPGDSSWNFTLGGVFTFDMTDNTTRAASGASVQKVLWNMLGYGTSLNATELALKAAYSGFIGSGDYANVRIANLVKASDHSVDYQDQFAIVPEATTILVWSVLATMGLTFSGRRRNDR